MVALWVLSAAAAFVYPGLPGEGLGRAAVKTLAVGLLALIAGIGGAGAPAAALTLSALGDFLLARPGERAFLAGVGAFGAAHLVYVGVFVSMTDVAAVGPLRIALAFGLVVLALGLGRILLRGAGGMRGAIAGYIGLLTFMGLAALAVPGWQVPLGAMLFVLSDSLLGLERFGPPSARHPGQGVAVWATYYAAQVTLTLALLPA